MKQVQISVEDLAEVRQLVANGEAKRIRTEARVKRSEIARQLEVSEPAVARWEAGERMPTGRPAIEYLRILRHLRLLEVAP